MSPSSLLKLQQLPGLFDPALSTKVLGVAEKYQEQVRRCRRLQILARS